MEDVICVAFCNQKGGVAKTNTAGNVAAEIAATGRSVLLIDMDPQATLTTWLIGRFAGLGIAEVLLGEKKIDEVAVSVPAFGCRLVPASPDALRVAERTLAATVGSEKSLRRAIRAAKADVVVIDTPPAMGILTAAALVAASDVIVPVSSSAEALDGLAQMLANVGRLKEAEVIPETLPVRTLLTRYDSRRRVPRGVADLVANFTAPLLESRIRENAALQELFGNQAPARTHAPGSTGAADYAALALEILGVHPTKAVAHG